MFLFGAFLIISCSKRSLKQEFDPVSEALKNMCYLYEKLGKKLRELKYLCLLLKDEYEMYGASIIPQRALGTRWIDHKMNAVRQVIDKLLYWNC